MSYIPHDDAKKDYPVATSDVHMQDQQEQHHQLDDVDDDDDVEDPNSSPN